MRDVGATIFNALAAMVPILMKQPEGPGDRDHRARVVACAATPPEFWRPFEQRFGVHIVEGYGLTETAGFCACCPPAGAPIPSFGKAMPFVEMAVFDEQDRPVPPRTAGEVVVRALEPHALMEGYFKQPDATATAKRGGWFHTGDRGYQDEAGHFYFLDRMKQSIRRRGENISSWEVEKAVNSHPAVLESAAVGVPSELGEEDVKICVVVRPGASLTPEALLDWCQDRLAYFMVPRCVELRAALPKTATERVEKYKLKAEGRGNSWDREAAGYRLRRG